MFRARKHLLSEESPNTKLSVSAHLASRRQIGETFRVCGVQHDLWALPDSHQHANISIFATSYKHALYTCSLITCAPASRGSPWFKMTTQEALDTVYKDIVRLNVIQVANADRLGRKVVVFSACRLPDFDKDVYQRLYDYIRKTLEQHVANDYPLVYFHYGFTKEKRPPRRWMLQAYRGFDRNFKKNLKGLYIVHPTSHVHFIINFFRPLVSRKFGKKIHFINQLSELWVDMYLDQIHIPKRVKS
ncbi:hypothetical protein Aperf_G00000007657 [Anoplocephala perfoliata]